MVVSSCSAESKEFNLSNIFASELVRKDRVEELESGNKRLKAQLDLIEQKLSREAEERRRDIHDCTVKLLTELGMMSPNQSLVFKKEVRTPFKEGRNLY